MAGILFPEDVAAKFTPPTPRRRPPEDIFAATGFSEQDISRSTQGPSFNFPNPDQQDPRDLAFQNALRQAGQVTPRAPRTPIEQTQQRVNQQIDAQTQQNIAGLGPLTLPERETSRLSQRPDLAGGADLLRSAGEAGSIVDSFTGAPIRGGLIGLGEGGFGKGFSRAREAFIDPSTASGRDLPGINRLPDKDVLPLGLSIRDVAGGVGEAAADVGVLAGGLKIAGRAAARGAAEAAAPRLTVGAPHAAQKLTDFLKTTPKLTRQQDELRRIERGKRLGAGESRLADTSVRGEARFQQATQPLAGDLPTASFDVPDIANAERTGLFDFIADSEAVSFTDKLSAKNGLVRTLTGELPARKEIEHLEAVFGRDFADALRTKQPSGRKALETAIDAAGIPGALLSAGDISFPFRQGALLLTRKEWYSSWAPMFRALVSEKWANQIDEAVTRSPTARRAIDVGGVDQTSFNARKLSARSEQIQTTMADKIPVVGPIVRASERAFVTFGNKVRHDYFTNFADGLDRKVTRGLLTPEERDLNLREIGRWLNIATGRADLPTDIARSEAMVIANRAIFSPRLNVSRIQALIRVPETIVGRTIPTAANPLGRKIPNEARKAMARDLVGFAGAGVGALTTGHVFGLWDVELDPRSSDFGKGRAGNTRYDPWAGNQQWVRFIEQMRTGESKNSDTGNVREIDRRETSGRFVRGKADPFAAIVIDAWTGETFLGEDFDPSDPSQVAERFIFLSVQDMNDAVREEGAVGAFKALPSVVGVGVSTFSSTASEQNEVARERGFESFDDLLSKGTPEDVQAVEDDPRVQEKVANNRSDFALAAQKRFEQQEIDDGKAQRGELTWEQWADARTARVNRSLGAIDATLGSDPIANPDTPFEEWLNEIKRNEGTNGEIDWDAVDAWRAGQSNEANNFIDNKLLMGDTPLERERRLVAKEMDETAYFEIPDQLWERLKESLGDNAPGTAREFVTGARERAVEVLEGPDSDLKTQLLANLGQARSVSPVEEAALLTGRIPAVREYNRILTSLHASWKQQFPELAERAARVGMATTTITVRQELAAQEPTVMQR